MLRDISGELHSDGLSLGDKSMVHDLVDVGKNEEHASGFICQFKCCFQQKALKDALRRSPHPDDPPVRFTPTRQTGSDYITTDTSLHLFHVLLC